jgi:UDP-N-acetylglucosamine--N-acetylmuramyl-(pentapeptide) pyrophosphoryl-undecaprenol N-acetylglucosamine transferase
VPIVVHDANVRAGLANRIGALLTRHVFTAHPGTKLPHATCVGIPIRKEISGLNRLAMADKAREHFGLRPDLPVLLVTGGSQGARSVNLAVLDAAAQIRAAGIQVLHLLGPRSGLDVHLPPAGPPYVMLPYVDRMDLAYAAADFALCRSGALTCAELTTVGLPAAYVPLPHGNGEQRLNALPIERVGGGLIVDDAALSPQWICEVLVPVMLDTPLVADDELTAEWIRDILLPVLVNIDQVADMSEAAASLGRGDADRLLAEAVIKIVAGTEGNPHAHEPDAE